MLQRISTTNLTACKIKRSNTGLGLFAIKPIKKNTYIIEYTGKIINNKQRNEKGGKYLFEINSRKTIDGSSRDNLARYINHACKPNCDIDIKKYRVYIVSKKDIQPGEEITYDYGNEYFDAYIKPFGCKCSLCRVKK